MLCTLGLGQLTLGQSATTLSGSKAQRIEIAAELTKLQRSKHPVYILDEPTTGLNLADAERLLKSINQLTDTGHTVLLIEHHVDVIKTADYVIDLGPNRAHAGGGGDGDARGDCGMHRLAHWSIFEDDLRNEATQVFRTALRVGRFGTMKERAGMIFSKRQEILSVCRVGRRRITRVRDKIGD